MSKNYFWGLVIFTFLFVGCAEKNLSKDETESVSNLDKNTTLVINKGMNECVEYNIILDRNRLTDFLERTPKERINQTLQSNEKISKDLCHFFEQETSLEKIEKAKELASNIIASCEKVGVQLSETGIQNKVEGLPFFVIQKGLKIQNESTVEECELMKKRYK